MKNPDGLQVITFTLLLILCWNIENIAGLAVDYKKWSHALLNGKFILLGFIPQLITGVFFIKTIQWTSTHHFGLLYYLPHKKHLLLFFIMSFIALDLGEYVYHVLMHKTFALWRFHAVHHSDMNVDVSTTLREHPCENFIRNLFTLMWVFVTGAVLWAVFFRQIIQIISNLLVHMNYQLPEKIDSIVGLLFITPNLHQVHHHYQRPFTDRNYGDVLSIWDRMFGTFCKMPRDQIIFGLDEYMDQKINSKYISLLKLPFTKKTKRGKT